jgi:hypothetical protein
VTAAFVDRRLSRPAETSPGTAPASPPQEAIGTMRLHRPPAVPLVTIDPHTNVWSAADRLTDDWPRHWTGSKMALYGVVRVDGVAYRFMGGREWLANAAEQVALTIDATKTRYAFRCGPIELGVAFVSPMLVDDLDLLSRPATFLTISARALDAEAHRISVYVDMTGEWAVNLPHERVTYELREAHGVKAATFRSELQRILPEAGITAGSSGAPPSSRGGPARSRPSSATSTNAATSSPSRDA